MIAPLTLFAVTLAVVGAGVVALALRLRRDDPVRALLADGDVDAVHGLDGYHQALELPFSARVARTVGGALQRFTTSLVPRNAIEEIRAELVTAGITDRVTAEEYVAARVVSAAIGVAAGLAAAVTVGGVQGLAMAALAVVIGVLAPPAYVARLREERIEAIRNELPDALDLLAICVEAGQGFEGALAAVSERHDSVLTKEIGHTLREMQLGRSRAEALRELQRRAKVSDLDELVMALIQADELGMPLTRVLRTQADEMRRRRRQRVRESAAQLPVKILFPLVVFIFPALFVIVLGPAGLQMARTL